MHQHRNHRSIRKSFQVQDVTIELEEDYRTHKGFRLIERGRGYVRLIVLYEEELRWLSQLCQRQVRNNGGTQQLGSFKGGGRTLLCSVIGVGYSRRLEIRLFAPYGRRQVRFPESSKGTGWSFLSQFLSSLFTKSRPPNSKKEVYFGQPTVSHVGIVRESVKSKSYVQAAAIPIWQLSSTRSTYNNQCVMVNQDDAAENMLRLNRCLVGRLGGPGERIMETASLSDWVNRKWRIPGGVVVKEIDEERFLFIFPSNQLAEKMKEELTFINGIPLWLDSWHSWCCCSRRGWNDYKDVWVKIVGLPLFLWNVDVLRNIGNHCGGFIEAEPDLFSKSSYKWARIKVRGDGSNIPGQIRIRVGQTEYNCPLWVERRTRVECANSTLVDENFRQPEAREREARGQTAGVINAHTIGNRKDGQLFKTGHGKTKGHLIEGGKVHWRRVAEQPTHLRSNSNSKVN